MTLPEPAWRTLLDASARAEGLERSGARETLDFLAWQPGTGWTSQLPAEDPRAALVELYLPLCSATRARPMTVGHLGQSLDGFIATPTGDSQFVTGEQNILHLHRVRALCDAVIVGAGTVAADNPQLTTRLVEGPNPLRVVFDPTNRLPESYRLFTDGAAPTMHVTNQSVVGVLQLLRDRGCSRIFVEGGGVTVSAFLEADLLDRLQIAIAPVLIGEGRPAIRLTPQLNLRDCRRPSYRVFRMGGDILFDCDLHADCAPSAGGGVSRVI
ncbi:MAG: RibD family protein [Vicinamibacterales bacterium]